MIEESIAIEVDGLRLDGRFAYEEAQGAVTAATLICPPHPFLGGDMDNNVVTALRDALVAAGLPVLRFNYRGIGASECARDLNEDQAEFWRDSSCPRYEAEIHRDCQAAFQRLRAEVGEVPLHLVGYSFGCLPALDIAAREPVSRLLLISPPLAKWRIAAALPTRVAARGLFFAPGDFACPEADIEALYAALPEPKALEAFADADHFFVGHERSLAAAASRFLEAA
ncbi:MAG: alpha/beta fold hydrolase [Gammaproteobacteria bacterium]|nr:alpha/beta fold hydrolase [Gammaproteobacteria bacterium]